MGIISLLQNRKKVLGLNNRNLLYIKNYNKAKAKKIADNKLLTKKILAKDEIPTPKLIGYIPNFEAFRNFNWDQLPNSFVIKPVSGLEGSGIEIFFNRDKQGNWIKADGTRFSPEQIKGLAGDIIDGKYSIHNQPDQVFFEERIRMHKDFQYYTYKGVPDVRIIVFNSIPIMSYIRFPTKASDGKANLAIGAIGAGIDISTGVTTSAIIGKSQSIEKIPGTKINISGLKIPYWNKILHYAVKAQRSTQVNFAGIDFLIDRYEGPLIVEINARPGLSIQLANKDGLAWRLKKAKGVKVQSVEKGVRLGKDLFGGAIEEHIERISGKNLIGILEDVRVYEIDALINDKNENKKKKKFNYIKTKAKIDTGADSTSIDATLAKKLGYEQIIDNYENLKDELKIPQQIQTTKQAEKYIEIINQKLKQDKSIDISLNWVRSSHGISIRLYIEIKIKLGGLTYTTKANIYDRSELKYKMIIGRKSLSNFLVEPSRRI